MTEKNLTRISWLCIVSLVSLYIYLFIRISLCKYFNFLYSDWDLAIYNQVFRGLINGKPYLSLVDVPFLGIHAEITMIFFAPIYALFSHPITLLVIQSVMLGIGAIPLFLIAKDKLNITWGLIFVIIYLFYPAVGYVNLNEFHPESCLPFIQFYLFYFFIRDDFKKFSFFMFLCLFAKENMPLMLIMIGLYALIERRKKRWIILPILSGIIWFLFYLKVISPSLNQGRVEFYSIYGHLGNTMGQIIYSLITHPIKALKLMFMPQKVQYLLNLFGPLSFLSFLSPSILLITLPNFLQHLLSLRLTEVSLNFYYPVEILAFIFISAIFGLRSLLQLNSSGKQYRYAYYIIIPAVALFFSFKLGPQLYILKGIKLSCQRTEAAVHSDNLVNMVPKNSSVICTFGFLPKLSDATDRLYSLHYVITGQYNLNKKYALPNDVEFALINFADPLTFGSFYFSASGNQNLRKFFQENQWGLVKVIDNTALFKKNYKSKYSLYESVGSVPEEGMVRIVFDDSIELISFKIENKLLANKDNIHFTFFWDALKIIDNEYCLFIMVLDSEARVVYNTIHPLCYRIYPTNIWKEEEIIKEDYWMLVPSSIKSGSYQLYIGLFDSQTGKTSVISSTTSKEINSWLIKLTDIQII